MNERMKCECQAVEHPAAVGLQVHVRKRKVLPTQAPPPLHLQTPNGLIIVKSNCVKALSATRLQVEQSPSACWFPTS